MGVNGFGAVLPLLSLVGQPVMVTLIKEPPLLTMHRREVLRLLYAFGCFVNASRLRICVGGCTTQGSFFLLMRVPLKLWKKSGK